MRALLALAGPCLRLAPEADCVVRRVQRLFFLNEGQDLSRFLVANLGIVRYPAYAVSRVRPAFADRAALLAYEAALGHAAALDEALEVRSFRRWATVAQLLGEGKRAAV